MAEVFVWYDESKRTWNVGAETTRGNSWASDYTHLAGGFTDRESAQAEVQRWRYDYHSNSFVRREP